MNGGGWRRRRREIHDGMEEDGGAKDEKEVKGFRRVAEQKKRRH
jgi:hypothetical protein